VVYDAAREETYQHIPSWIRAVSGLPEMGNAIVPVFIVGNKTDLISEPPAIPVGRKTIGKWRVFFYDVSLKLGTNIERFREGFFRAGLEDVKTQRKTRTK
jgi:GTPase SAR1 family protein